MHRHVLAYEGVCRLGPADQSTATPGSWRPGRLPRPRARQRPRHLPPALTVLFLAVVATAGLWFVVARDAGAAESEVTPGGAFLFARDCVSCHGPAGNGTSFGPTLQGRGAGGIDFVLRTGRMPLLDLATLGDAPYDQDTYQVPPAPPAYSETEIAAIVDYTRGFVSGPDVPNPDIASADRELGAQLYQRNCAACHAWSGAGGALTDGQKAPTLDLSDEREIVEAIRLGPGTMPLFADDIITDGDAADIATYVTYLQAPEDAGGLALAHLGPVAEGFIAWAIGIVGLLGFVRWIGRRP